MRRRSTVIITINNINIIQYNNLSYISYRYTRSYRCNVRSIALYNNSISYVIMPILMDGVYGIARTV